MRLVGLTGGIGSGKSTVSALLVERGAKLVDADAITRALQKAGGPVFVDMVNRFGKDIVGRDGELDRAAVAAIVFADASALADLNAIVHPAVGTEVANQIASHAKSDDVVVLDIPLLVEGKTEMPYVGVLVVDAPVEVAIKRLTTHRGMSVEDATARIANQATRAERLARADFVVDNSGTLEALVAQADLAWTWMSELRTPSAG